MSTTLDFTRSILTDVFVSRYSSNQAHSSVHPQAGIPVPSSLLKLQTVVLNLNNVASAVFNVRVTDCVILGIVTIVPKLYISAIVYMSHKHVICVLGTWTIDFYDNAYIALCISHINWNNSVRLTKHQIQYLTTRNINHWNVKQMFVPKQRFVINLTEQHPRFIEKDLPDSLIKTCCSVLE